MRVNLPNLDPVTQKKLQRLLDTFPDYDLHQDNGQRQFGPPNHAEGTPRPKGCEVFVGKLPRDLFEDEMVPVFSMVGPLHKVRLMMDFSGTTRGYAFVQYTNRADARKAVNVLHNFEIRHRHRIAVTPSVDNCRLYVGGLPVTKPKEEIREQITSLVKGVSNVLMYSESTDATKHRGFAFIDFETHRDAALARRCFFPSPFGDNVTIDWAEPEMEIDEEKMRCVKVLFVRSLLPHITENSLRRAFSQTVPSDAIEKVKKCKDFAFVHFFSREAAEICLNHWHGRVLDGGTVQVMWAKPVSREEHSNHKMMARFNRGATPELDRIFHSQPPIARIDSSGSSFSQSGSPRRGNPSRTSAGTEPVIQLATKCGKFGFGLPFFQYFAKGLRRDTRDPNDPLVFTCKVTLQNCIGMARSFQPDFYSASVAESQAATSENVLSNWNRLDKACLEVSPNRPSRRDVPLTISYEEALAGAMCAGAPPAYVVPYSAVPFFAHQQHQQQNQQHQQYQTKPRVTQDFSSPPPGYFETMYFDRFGLHQ